MVVERRSRTPVVDLSRPGGRAAVELAAAEAAEVLMSVCALAMDDPETLDLGEERIAAIRAAADPAVLDAVAEVAGADGKLLARLLGLVYETPPPRSFPAFLERLRAADPHELLLVLLGHRMRGYHLSVPAETILAAARGDADARARLLELTAEWPEDRRATARLLELGGGAKEHLLTLMPRWYDEIFRPLRDETLAAVERDARAREQLAATHTAAEIVELTTVGVRFAPGPDVRRVVFFPTWWLRPWVMLIDHDDVKIVCYPAAASVAAGEQASVADAARAFKALGDEGRLSVLRRLAEGPLTLGEAAGLLGVGKSTAHHHLGLLRQAGFVVVSDEPERLYTLRQDLLPHATALLEAALGGR